MKVINKIIVIKYIISMSSNQGQFRNSYTFIKDNSKSNVKRYQQQQTQNLNSPETTNEKLKVQEKHLNLIENLTKNKVEPNVKVIEKPKGTAESNHQLSEFQLRGSCNNIKKFDYSNYSRDNPQTNLRNTTHFNPVSKYNLDKEKDEPKSTPFLPSASMKFGNNLKIPTQESNIFTQDSRMKQFGQGGSTHSFINNKTPTKTMDQSLNLTGKSQISKTPTKYVPKFDKDANKTKDNFTKNNKSPQSDKKNYKSLNEILQTKFKQKNFVESPNRKQSPMLNGFELGAVLGKGKFGEVYLVRNHEAGFMGAIKKVQKKKVKQYKMVDQFVKEIRLHSCLDHPNIVKFYGAFDDKQYIYLVMEYLNGGTLFDYLNEVNSLSLKETVEYLRDIIEALNYMHEKSIAHRDIKPQNIVISSEGVAKLCDFGWSTVVETSRMTYCGTFDYAPPEILQRKNYDTSVDIWCIGVLCYQLLTGRVPFEGQQRNEIRQKIVNVDKHKIEYPKDVPLQARQFVEALMQKDPNQRPKSNELLKFKLFSLYPSKTAKGKK